MKEKEILLFKELCKFKSNTFDQSLIAHATPHVLGQLFFNRMQGVAYGTLKKHGQLGNINREFRNALKSAFDTNVKKNVSYFECVSLVSDILKNCNCGAAMLKGAWLCAHYPDGYRTSNDIDLLVLPKDVTTIGQALLRHGFCQGNVRNGEFVPATRKEIIESKMMRGETVPYIKEVNLPEMKYLEVDINFSLDYKNGEEDILADILHRREIVEEKGMGIPTLSSKDFFVHLCAHLYKEATTFPWIAMRRDMTLYKYGDIYLLLSEMSEADVEQLFAHAKTMGMEKVCGYAVSQTAELFDMIDTAAYLQATQVLKSDPDFLRRVVSPAEKKVMFYQTADTQKRFFMYDRVLDLQEVLNVADT